MATLKKNQVNQILFTMVDKTDFATIETSLASNFTVKTVGVNHGSAAATISTLSRIVSKVGSGVYRLSLEANMCNYDYMLVRVAHASAATQMLAFEMATYDDTDIYSHVSDIQSNLASFIGNWGSYASDVASAVWAHAAGASVVNRVSRIVSIASDAHSAAILGTSIASDTQSALDSQYTKVYSGINALTSQLLLVKSLTSDAHSAAILGASHASEALSLATIINSRVLVVQSIASDAHSAAAQANSRALVIESTLSDIDSALTSRFSDIHSYMSTTGVGLDASTMSDLRSAIAAGPAATITASDISNIASAVWGFKWDTNSVASSFGSAFEVMLSNLSDILSAATQINSRVLLTQSYASDAYSVALVNRSLVSDVYSLVSDVQSAVAAAASASDVASKVWAAGYSNAWGASTFGSMLFKKAQSGFNLTASDISDLRSAIAAGPTATVTASDISNIASAVWAFHYATNSLASSFGSAFELILSRTSDAHSAAILAASLASDTHSLATQINSRVLLAQSMASDAHSAAAQANSRALVIQSITSDVQSALDSQALLNASWFSDIDSALTSRFSDLHSFVSTTMGGSDMYSKVGKLVSRIQSPVATQSKLGVVESHASLTYSQAKLGASYASDVYSLLNGASWLSDLGSVIWGNGTRTLTSATAPTITASDISNIASAVWAADYSVLGAANSSFGSMMNKFKSRITAVVATSDQLSKAQSDIRSAVSTTGGGVTVSNISDIASAVWAYATAASLVSRVSDIQSAVDSQYSDLKSAINAGGLNTSAISDIASAVWGQKFKGVAAHNVASTFGSAFALMTSRVSDIDSAIDSQYLVQASSLSDIQSQLTVVQSMASDAHSAAAQANSRALVIQSIASDAHSAAILGASHASDAYSVALLCRSMISDVESALDSQYAAGQFLNASGLSDVGSVIDARLDTAYTDATALNANGVKERLRALGWIMRNKLVVTDASGDAILYKDDGTTSAFKVTAQFTDTGVVTTRKRYA